MTPLDDLNEFELRLQGLFCVPLPVAPRSLLDRLDAAPTAPAATRRPRVGLLLVPGLLVMALAAIALNAGNRPVPSGQFEAIPIDLFDRSGMVTDVWALDSAFYGALWSPSEAGEVEGLIRSENGRRWEIVPAPRDGLVVASGAVVDGELHVLGYTGTFQKPEWWHYVVGDNGAWREIGQLSGMPVSTYVVELVHGSAGWLARITYHVRGGDGLRSVSGLRWSDDGLQWSEPALPPSEFLLTYTGVATDGSSLTAFRYDDREDEPRPTEALVSRDGRAWTAHPLDDDNAPRFAAFHGGLFAAIGSAREGSSTVGAAWTSIDGRAWQRSDFDDLVAGVPGHPKVITVANAGFVTVGRSNGDVWLSPDGATWQAIAGLVGGQTWNPISVAARGTVIVVGGQGADSKPMVWVGSFSYASRM